MSNLGAIVGEVGIDLIEGPAEGFDDAGAIEGKDIGDADGNKTFVGATDKVLLGVTDSAIEGKELGKGLGN